MSFLPSAAREQHIAITGKTGSGKTTTAKSIVEQDLDAGLPVAVIDPTSAWWGLRSSADGKSPGYPVVVLGGDHADAPLSPLSGKACAALVANDRVSAIFDVRELMVNERNRWFTDFATELFRANRSPLRLVLDEAHLFAPQGKVPDPETGKMLHAANTIASSGRSRGIRCLWITQRPAKLHKDTLTCADTLIPMRVIAPQDRDAIEAWVLGCGDKAKGREVLDSLAQLARGEGWVWFPEGGVLKRMQFPAIRTFDSSATPTGGEAPAKPKTLAEIDLSAITASMAAAVAEAEANDPKKLRAELDRVKGELKKALATPVSVAPEEMTRLRRRTENLVADLNDALLKLKGMRDAADGVDTTINSITSTLAADPAHPLHEPNDYAQLPAEAAVKPRNYFLNEAHTTHVPRSAPTARVARPPGESPPGGGLGRGERAILTACAQYPEGCDRVQLGVLTGYARSSRDAYLQRLAQRGLVTRDEPIRATPAGIEALGDFEPLPRGSALRDHWLKTLPEGEARILRVCIQAWPEPVARETLSDRTGYARSSRDAYVQRLGAKKLVVTSVLGVAASPRLFDDWKGVD